MFSAEYWNRYWWRFSRGAHCILLSPGLLSLVGITDRFSRYVLAGEVSHVLETAFYAAPLDEALRPGSSEVFNTDQGVQFLSADRITEQGS